jgi:hypothetical protein
MQEGNAAAKVSNMLSSDSSTLLGMGVGLVEELHDAV